MLTAIKKTNKIFGYLYRNFAAPRIYSHRDRDILSKNLELRNKFSGQRCFLIGAGPSITQTNLAKLRGEYTFVMNEFEKNEQYKSLAPKFHILIEGNYYKKGAPEHWLNRFKEKGDDIPPETTIITGVGAKQAIENYDLFKKHNIYYVGMKGIFTNNVPFNIGLNKYVPEPKNSMLMCMMTAAWMGFKEIYLLGCEHNFLAKPLGQNKSLSFSHSGYGKEVESLAYVDTSELGKYITEKEMSFTYEANMASTLQLFRNYRLFYAKAQKVYPGLKILNATPDSFLDVFPVINFNDIKGL